MNIWTRRYKKVQGNWQFLEAHQKVTCPILASFSSTWYFSFIPSFQLSPIYTFPTGKVVARRMSWTESNEIVSPRSSKDHLLYLIKPKVLFLPWWCDMKQTLRPSPWLSGPEVCNSKRSGADKVKLYILFLLREWAVSTPPTNHPVGDGWRHLCLFSCPSDNNSRATRAQSLK